jgi:hypothetical protein
VTASRIPRCRARCTGSRCGPWSAARRCSGAWPGGPTRWCTTASNSSTSTSAPSASCGDVVDPWATSGSAERARGLLAATLRRELDDAFLAEVDAHVRALRFRAGVRVSARLSAANTGTGYLLEPPAHREAVGTALAGLVACAAARRPRRLHLPPAQGRRQRRARPGRAQARGLGRTAEAIGSLRRHPVVLPPAPRRAGVLRRLPQPARAARWRRPPLLPRAAPGRAACSAPTTSTTRASRSRRHRVVANDVDADGADLVVVTGANQGGKTTFLRSVGVAQLMMQSGMFVPARSFRAASPPACSPTSSARRTYGCGAASSTRSSRLSDVVTSSLRVPAAPQRVVRLHQRARGIRPGRPGVARAHRVGRPGAVRHPPEPVRARSLRPAPGGGALSCRPSGSPTGPAPSACAKGAPAPPATASDLYRQVFAVPVRERS